MVNGRNWALAAEPLLASASPDANGENCWIAAVHPIGDKRDMDDQSALRLALDAARAFQQNERSPLETARTMTGIVNPWRSWWHDLGGADGPLSQLYAADDEAMKLPWIGSQVERWHPDVREAKRRELQDAEDRWREPVGAACDALLCYAKPE